LKTLKTYNLAPKNWTSDDLATFILHDATDPNRIDNLMMTLQFAEYKKIPIFIITNNALPKNNQQEYFTDLFKFLGVTVEKDFILGGGTEYPKTKYQVILDKVIPFAEGEEEERKRATTGSSKTGETKSDEQSKKTSSKSENVSKNPPSSSFGGSKKTKKRKFRKKKRKPKRKKSILKTRKKKKKKNKFTKRK
jgi:hypothetical protein